MAHRGFSGAYPENTLEAFEAAASLGVQYIELDVHMSRDGEIVVCHDPELDRTTNVSGRISELDYATILKADAGYNFRKADGSYPFRNRGLFVPRLSTVFSRLPHLYFVVEIKQVNPSLTGALKEAVRKAGMERRVLIASEHQQALDEVRALLPSVPTNLSALETASFFTRLASGFGDYRPPGEALQIPPVYESLQLVTKESIEAAHSLGLEVHVWTVNDPYEIRRLLGLGVEGIITDYPDRALAALKA